ncbi:hypothetical protein J1N35_031254 [Gossypium stocksii]|uniref:Uncharacterized protein n=1 Tax=Gossypium stocksii TaxID=47602 RepID=A0A9D3V293_9ROSI|nr:hypothetical protein J1N35_031254 [Gossypium stocksii]
MVNDWNWRLKISVYVTEMFKESRNYTDDDNFSNDHSIMGENRISIEAPGMNPIGPRQNRVDRTRQEGQDSENFLHTIAGVLQRVVGASPQVSSIAAI